jgi:hypothetical protein
MAKGPASGKNDAEILDYRHDRARRKNNPPAGLAAQGRIAERPTERYATGASSASGYSTYAEIRSFSPASWKRSEAGCSPAKQSADSSMSLSFQITSMAMWDPMISLMSEGSVDDHASMARKITAWLLISYWAGAPARSRWRCR